MVEENFRNKIIIKILLSFILIGIICFLILYNNSYVNSIEINKVNSTTTYKYDYLEYINKFIKLVNSNKYERAFSLLSEDYKSSQFNNNIEEFTNFIKQYDFNSKYTIKYLQISKRDGSNDIYHFSCNFNDKTIIINVISEKPYSCKLSFSTDDLEG